MLASALVLGACSDDAADADDASGTDADTGTTSGGSHDDATASADTTSSATMPSDTDEESEGTTEDPPPTGCVPTSLPGPIGSGQWDERFTLPGLTGLDGFAPFARDVASDTDGTVLVAGYFRWADGAPMQGLARWDGTGWMAPTPNWDGMAMPPEGFSAVALGPNGEIAAAATDLNSIGNGEVWLDLGDGPEVIAQHTGMVRRLLWFQGELWAVGTFEIAGGGPSGLARWDGTQWLPAPDGAVDGPAFELLASSDGNVYVGGGFTQIGGIPANRVARWDGAQWTAMSMPQALRVLALELDDEGTLFAGGSFVLDDGNIDSAGLARWTGTAWEIEAGGVAQGPAFGVVSDLLFRDGTMLVAGCFNQAGGGNGGQPIDAGGLARLTNGQWEALDESGFFGTVWYDPGACGFEPADAAVFDMTHQRLVADGTNVWLVGSFGGKEDVVSRNVISYRDDEWHAAGTPGLGLSGSIMQMAVDPSRCEVLGLSEASHAGGEPLGVRLARYDRTGGWTAASPPFPADAGRCATFVPRASGEVVLGCGLIPDDFGPAEGQLHRLVGGAWELVADLPGPVHDLALAPDDAVWVAGGSETGYVARFAEGRIAVVEDQFDSIVTHVDVAGTIEEPRVVVAGPFSTIGGQPFDRIALFDEGQWQPLGRGLSTQPSALAVTDDVVYAATHDEWGVTGRIVLGMFENGSWTELADAAHGLPAPIGESSHTFLSLLPLDGGLLAVGYVWPETGGRNAFYFDGDQFTAIGGGIAGMFVEDVVLVDDALLFSGWIAEVGPEDDPTPSIGTARFAW